MYLVLLPVCFVLEALVSVNIVIAFKNSVYLCLYPVIWMFSDLVSVFKWCFVI